METNPEKNGGPRFRRGWKLPRLKWALGQKAAKIHIIESRERYWILRREIEHYIDKAARDIGIHDWRLETDGYDAFYIRQHIINIDSEFREKCSERESHGTSGDSDCACEVFGSAFPRLLNYYKILLINESRLQTRDYEELSLLLRDLNFIRTRLISDKMVGNSLMLLNQLDFCRIEARNLGLQENPEIKAKMDQAAEEIDASQTAPSNNNDKARRLIVSLMANLNDYRVKQIFDQIYKKNKYMSLCIILITLSIIIFEVTPSFIETAPDKNLNGGSLQQQVDVGSSTEKSVCLKATQWEDKEISSIDDFRAAPIWKTPQMLFLNVLHFLINLIASNQLYYLFFAGFTGGTFSLMMEFKPQNKLPGDEIYTSWYYRTRPIIGAFGAMVMYIIIVSSALSGGLDGIVSKEIINELECQPLSATGFAFGFITGFTERIILPKLH